MPKRKLWIFVVVITLIMVVFAFIGYYYWTAGVCLTVLNRGAKNLTNIQIDYTGGTVRVERLEPESSFRTRINPSGESHLELKWLEADKKEHAENINIYFERNYRGAVTLTIDAEGPFTLISSSSSLPYSTKTKDLLLHIENHALAETVITKENLVKIKEFIIKKGLRETYCNMYNDNPSYRTTNYAFHLNPDTGQKNINCKLDESDFNHLTIHHLKESRLYQNICFKDERLISIRLQSVEDTSISKILNSTTQAVEEILKEIENSSKPITSN